MGTWRDDPDGDFEAWRDEREAQQWQPCGCSECVELDRINRDERQQASENDPA